MFLSRIRQTYLQIIRILFSQHYSIIYESYELNGVVGSAKSKQWKMLVQFLNSFRKLNSVIFLVLACWSDRTTLSAMFNLRGACQFLLKMMHAQDLETCLLQLVLHTFSIIIYISYYI